MQSERTQDVYEYWNSLRQGASAPLRSDFDPSVLRRRLPDLFMLELSGPDLIFRLAGTRICELYRRELRHHRFLSLWQGADQDKALEAALAALRTEEAVVINLSMRHGLGDTPCEMLLMPIRSSGKLADRLLGCLLPLAPVSLGKVFSPGCMQARYWLPATDGFDPDATPTVGEARPDIRPLLQRLVDAARMTRRR
ncbi:PAS domain-containing protein [Allorhizobium pseudoryzae]|uniref:PAS domain-containing protein n=1 Tax=Allorhizobium pseudoryzae TaxID=379684 RepID=UPI003D0907B9